jgi:hypothetical protein
LKTEVHAIESTASRLIHSASPKERIRFLQELDYHYAAQNLYERLTKLWGKTEWNHEDEIEFNKCDWQHIQGMLAAEKKTCRVKTHAWSPKYSNAVEQRNFWKIILTLKRHHTKPDAKTLAWARALEIENVELLTIPQINTNLRKAQRTLREVQKEAIQLREEHLRDLLEMTQDTKNDKEHERRLKILIRAHKKQYAYKKIQHILKPQQRTGLAHILVPEDSTPETFPYDPDKVKTWKMIHDHETLQRFLIERNKSHFGQAHGTPFTKPPLDSLDWGAMNQKAESLLGGEIPTEFNVQDQSTNEILQHIANRKQLPEIELYITPEEIAKGFRRWKESTSTSPSGCHLGLRRIPTIPTMDEETEKIRQQILHVQTHIINIPLHYGFSPTRWQTVVNAMLEKIQGRPMLHKLRVIHIMEADYNLILKIIFGKRLMQNCEKHETLGQLQDGFRKGRSTTRTLLHNEIMNDYNKRLRIDNYVGMTDISGCFDRILPPIISLLNRKNGCPKTAVQMHAQTLLNAKYHLKTKQGISEMFYSNSMTPVYGNGQGAGDSPSQWSQESAMLFDIYESKMNGAEMSLRTGERLVKLPIAAFADDTNLLGNNDHRQKSRSQLTQEVQQAFATWDKLLHASGHFMELAKCGCYLSIWEFQEDGYAYTMLPEEHKQEIYVTDINGIKQKISQLPTNKAQKLLGVMKSPMGDQQDEIKRLKEKSDKYATRLNSNFMTRSEARLAYAAFYIPAMRYSLNITSINQMDMETIQSRATTAFLAAQGFNRHMPREVVYAPTKYQGVGMLHLYDLQGTDGTRLFLQEINQFNSTTQHMLIALLDAIQLEAGIGTPIMEDCRPLDYIEWGWIPQIRDFLHHINGQIIVGKRKQMTYREDDSYLMDSEYLATITRRERIYIHRCRLYLQVETVSDIATAAGNTIHEAWKSPQSTKPSRSTLNWPRQNNPCKAAWSTWNKFLKSFTLPNGKLKKPLGPWTLRNKQRIHEAYTTERNEILWVEKGRNEYNGHAHIATQRKSVSFATTPVTTANELPPFAVPVDIIRKDKNLIKTSTVPKWAMSTTKSEELKWYERAPAHLEHIIGTVAIHSAEHEITNLFTNNPKIEIASDGGHEPSTGISTFGWVVAANSIIIAKGKGPTQVHPSLAESFRSEGYGLASACLFLQNLLRKFPVDVKKLRCTIYIDNKSLIQRMESFGTRTNIPRWNLRPDEDICKVAAALLRKLPVRLQHIKSHQDKQKSMDDLPFEAILNTIADKEATRQRQCMEGPATEVSIMGAAQLRIGDIAITRNSQKWLINTAGKIPIRQYYRDRFGWTDQTFEQISWDTQLAVLRQYKQEDQTRILKFVHGWLPTQHRKFKEGAATSPRCQLCSAMLEDNLHLLQCSHSQMRTTQYKLQKHILQQHQENGDSEIINIIEIGLSESAGNSDWEPNRTSISPRWRRGVEAQCQIGWNQLYFGRVAKEMIKAMETHYREITVDELSHNGERWARKMIRAIWDTILELWKTRNELINQKDSQETEKIRKEKLETRVRRCYSFKEKLRHGERLRWFTDSVEEFLQKDAHYIETWTKAAERIISITKREQKKRPRESFIMENFLQMNTTHDTTKNKPKPNTTRENSRKYIQDMNPD